MNYWIVVYFWSTNYWTDLKLCGTTLYTLNRSFKYFCGMYVKLCQVAKFCGIIFLCCRVIMIQVFVLTCIVDLIKVKAFLCFKMTL